MAVGIGTCYQGRITRIVPWGAFVTLEGTDGIQNGLIHISELSSGYVKQVSDLVSVGDTVTVRVLHIDDRGRIALSRRQAMTEEEQAEERQRTSALSSMDGSAAIASRGGPVPPCPGNSFRWNRPDPPPPDDVCGPCGPGSDGSAPFPAPVRGR